MDAAQTAGAFPIDVMDVDIDLLAFTGHKGLQGPPGTGGLVIGSGVSASQLDPLMRGGTGSRSDSQEQPEDLPDKYESGTQNCPGIAGLGAGVRWILDRSVAAVRAHELEMTDCPGRRFAQRQGNHRLRAGRPCAGGGRGLVPRRPPSGVRGGVAPGR